MMPKHHFANQCLQNALFVSCQSWFFTNHWFYIWMNNEKIYSEFIYFGTHFRFVGMAVQTLRIHAMVSGALECRRQWQIVKYVFHLWRNRIRHRRCVCIYSMGSRSLIHSFHFDWHFQFIFLSLTLVCLSLSNKLDFQVLNSISAKRRISFFANQNRIRRNDFMASFGI